jgi:hypothetical protein
MYNMTKHISCVSDLYGLFYSNKQLCCLGPGEIKNLVKNLLVLIWRVVADKYISIEWFSCHRLGKSVNLAYILTASMKSVTHCNF